VASTSGSAGGSIDIRLPQLGSQQMAAAEHVHQQIAVAIVIAGRTHLPGALQRFVGGINIKDDLPPASLTRLQKNRHEQTLDNGWTMGYLVIRCRCLGRLDALICCEISGLDGLCRDSAENPL
jgi:hypothetical protein